MRKIVISAVLSVLALLLFGTSALFKAKTIESDTIFQSEPGTRCTRLTYGPRLKKGQKPKPGEFGSRCTRLFSGPRKGKYLPNTPPKVGLSASTESITSGCAAAGCRASTNPTVRLKAITCDADNDSLFYTYSTTGGRITGDGAEVVWDLSGVQPGTYTGTVEVDDGCGCIAFSSSTVTVDVCPECR